MNRAVSNLAVGRSSEKLYKITFLDRKEWKKEVITGKKKKNGLVIAKLLSFRGFIGVCQADYLTSADQVIPD